MPILIGLYLFFGIAQVGSAATAAFLVHSRGESNAQEGYIVAGIGILSGLLCLFAAFGLWKRWRLMRLVLLGFSWWNLALGWFGVLRAMASLAQTQWLPDARRGDCVHRGNPARLEAGRLAWQ
jgi:hypothetical protein